MEPQTASVYPSSSVPRLRVTRRPSSTASSGLPSMQWSTDLKRSPSYPDSQATSEDELGTLGPAEATPRLLSASLPPPDNTTVSGDTIQRLRAVLDRFETSSRTPPSASHSAMPPSPSEPESDFDVPPAQAARASIKVLLQHALREPGETPQKPKLTRRASFNAVGSPKISKSRRKSTSDEENDTLAKRPDNLSTAASFDRLRLQLTESMPSIQASTSSISTSCPPSEAIASTLKRVTPSHHFGVPKVPVPNSSVRHPKSHQDLEPFTAVGKAVDSDPFPPQHENHSNHTMQQSPSRTSHAKVSHSVTRHHNHDTVLHDSSRESSTQSDADYRERLRAFQQETNIERERDWNRRNPPPPPASVRTSGGHSHSSTHKDTGRVTPGAWPTPTPLGTSPTSTRSRKHSSTKRESSIGHGHLEDGPPSRGTSASSNAEYRDRLKEADLERQQDLERNWNRPHPQHSNSAPHLHVQDSHPHDHLLHARSPAGSPRPHSRAGRDLARISSPSSSHSDHEKLEEHFEIEHERERNWNAPRPKWGQHPHHSSDHHSFPRAPSPLPPHVPGTGQDRVTMGSRRRTSPSASRGLSEDEHPHSHPHPRLQHDPPRSHSRGGDENEHSWAGLPSSSTSSRPHQQEDVEELHERERNWNAPRPNWHQHPHHQPSGHETDHSRYKPSHSLVPSASVDKEREQGWNRQRPNASLGIPPDRHRTRSPSPTPLSRPHSSRSHNGHVESPASSAHASEARHPRSNSPLPQLNGVKGKGNEAGSGRGNGWDSPKVSPSHQHERTPSSPSPVPSRSESRASNPTSLTHALPAPHVSARRPTSPIPTTNSEVFPAGDNKKGHRRTITELSEAMGPFPRKNSLPPSLAMPDEESDGSLFADESVPPPRMSTPTFKRSHLPDLSLSPAASDIPLPPSPPSPEKITEDVVARADSDLARLQRAVAPIFTFPTRQSPPPETSALSTPLRRSSFNAKMQFKTPSPPLGLPDLPDPPSFEEAAKTPHRVNGHVEPPPTSWSTMKTPRVPGAFGTPAPPVSAPNVGYSVEGDVSSSSDDAETTPKLEPVDAATQSQTLASDDMSNIPDPAAVPLTPAPPGAYRATPTPSKLKGILKVRFDGDVHSSGLVNGTENTVNGIVSTTKVGSPPPSPSSEDIPPLDLSPSRRKGLRLVDEYGRARRFTQDGEEIILDSRRKVTTENKSPTRTLPSQSPLVEDVTMTPRRRAKMRQVDALGNEITGERKEPNGEVYEARTSRKAVFSRLTRSLGELKDDLAEQEEALTASMPQIFPRDDDRLMDLAVVSKIARVERNKLSRKLQLERHAAGGITDNVYAARNPLPPSEALTRASWWRRKWKLALCLVIMEFAVLCMGYRLASIHSKQAWLATHYDPFFPALYLRKTPPSFISRFGTLPVDWSAFAISGAVRQVGVRGFVEGVGRQLWEGMWNWRMEPWEAWGSPATGPPVPQPWPPS